MLESILWADERILIWLQAIRNPVCDAVFGVITHLADKGVFWMLLSLILLIPKKTRKAGVCSGIALVFSVLLANVVIKNIVCRPRPYEFFDTVRLMTGYGIHPADDWSFPSGHTSASFASSIALHKYLPRWAGNVLVALACVIAVSRIYIGIHYPTDVIAAVAIGIGCAYLARFLVERFWNPLILKWKHRRLKNL